MVKRKFEQELNSTLACDSLAHGVCEKTLCKKQKLPIPPKILLLLLYFMRRMQPIGYGVAIYILGLEPSVVLLSLRSLNRHSVKVLILFSSDSPCYLPSIMLSAAYK